MHRFIALSLAMAITVANAQVERPQGDVLEAQSAVIGEIVLDKSDVFDLSDPKENNVLYRLANRLHIITRDGTAKLTAPDC